MLCPPTVPFYMSMNNANIFDLFENHVYYTVYHRQIVYIYQTYLLLRIHTSAGCLWQFRYDYILVRYFLEHRIFKKKEENVKQCSILYEINEFC